MALGRGLGALITNTARGAVKSTDNNSLENLKDQRVWYVPVNKITPGEKQPRKNFNVEALEELTASIKAHGVLQPLLVVEKSDGGYELVAGERRLRAAMAAGLPTVPAIIKQFADQQKLEVALIENIQRANLNPIEEACAYQRLIDEFNLTQQDVADKVGKSRPAVANMIRLLALPEAVQTALATGKINTGHARALLTLATADEQLKMLSSMLGERITTSELEKTVAKKAANTNLHLRRDPNLLYLEDKLRKEYGTKVNITKKGGRGTIVFNYYSPDDFNRLLKKLISG